MIHLHTKFHMPSPNGSFTIAVQLKTKHHIRIQQKLHIL
jgi:hypothetical protein